MQKAKVLCIVVSLKSFIKRPGIADTSYTWHSQHIWPDTRQSLSCIPSGKAHQPLTSLCGKKALKIKVDSKHKFSSLSLCEMPLQEKVSDTERKSKSQLQRKATSANKASQCDRKSIILVNELYYFFSKLLFLSSM